MSLRDLVNGQGCDDGSGGYRNPMARFADTLYRDRSQREKQEWRETGEGRFMEQQGINTKMEEQLSTQTSMENQVEGFMHNNFGEFAARHNQPNMMDPLNALDLDYDEFDNFMRHDRNGGGMEEGYNPEMFSNMPISNQVPPDLLKQYIKSFIDANQANATFRPMNLPDFGFPESDKMTIKKRSEVLARHMYANQGERFVESQVDSFMNSFGGGRTNMRMPGGRFEVNDMVNEFEGMSNSRSLSHDDMERYYQEASQTRGWVDEFEDYRQNDQMERYFEEAQETNNWVDEFEGHRPIDKVGGGTLRDLTHTITQIQDPKLQNTNFMRFMSKISKGEVALRDNQVIEQTPEEIEANRWADEFESHRGKDESGVFGAESDRWAEEFSRDYEDRSADNQDWVNEFENFSEQQDWLNEFNSFSSQSNEYVFGDPEENPYMNHSNPYKKGIQLFDEGKISEAILAFEAEAQRNPDNAMCWRLLGQAHAENDKDNKAISALIKSIQKDSSDSAAHLALAVSYTNEMFRDEALDTLKNWLQSRPEYQHLRFNVPDYSVEGYNFKAYHNAVTDTFIEAAIMKADEPDADVQTALGLLFNLSMDYDKAVDCFRSALDVRPDDYLLWNKLGATLANSNHSEEALGCYFRALKVKPSYVRARSNLGISFMALKEYEKAAQYFLGALAMHPNARHIWTNLQMVFMSMERSDLLDKCAEMRPELFRDEFEF